MEIETDLRWHNRQVDFFFVPQIFAVRYIDSAPLKILNTKHHLAVKGEQNLYLGGNQYFGSNPPIWTLVHTKKKGPYCQGALFSFHFDAIDIGVCGGPQTLNDGGKVRAYIPFQNSCIIDIFILLSVANQPQQWLHQYTTKLGFWCNKSGAVFSQDGGSDYYLPFVVDGKQASPKKIK